MFCEVVRVNFSEERDFIKDVLCYLIIKIDYIFFMVKSVILVSVVIEIMKLEVFLKVLRLFEFIKKVEDYLNVVERVKKKVMNLY